MTEDPYAPCRNCGVGFSAAAALGSDGTMSERVRSHETGCPGDVPVSPPAGLADANPAVAAGRASEAEIQRLWWFLDAPDVPDAEPSIAGCGCNRCLSKIGWPLGFPHMVVCSTCGNKRCPHASDHRADCTNSNEWRPYGVKTNGVQP